MPPRRAKKGSLLDEFFTTAQNVKEVFLLAAEDVEAIGQVSPEVQDALNQVLRDREHVVSELADWYQHTAANLEGLRAQYQPILDRIRADCGELEKRLEFIKWCVTKALPPAKESQVANERAYVYYRESNPVIIDDLDSVPLEFIELVKQPVKKEIKRVIDAGGKVPGARVDVNFSPQIKPGGIKAIRAAEKRLKKILAGAEVDDGA